MLRWLNKGNQVTNLTNREECNKKPVSSRGPEVSFAPRIPVTTTLWALRPVGGGLHCELLLRAHWEPLTRELPVALNSSSARTSLKVAPSPPHNLPDAIHQAPRSSLPGPVSFPHTWRCHDARMWPPHLPSCLSHLPAAATGQLLSGVDVGTAGRPGRPPQPTPYHLHRQQLSYKPPWPLPPRWSPSTRENQDR